MAALLEQAAAFLKSRGATVVEVEGPKEGPIENDSFQVMLYEFKDGLNKYFARLARPAPAKNVQELIEFNRKDTVELRYFDQALLEMAQEKGDLEAAEYKKALAAMLKAARTDGIDKLMDDNKLDALMAPTGAPAWKTDLVDGDHFLGGSSSLAAISGYPSRHRAHGLRGRAAGGCLLLRPRLERAVAAGDRLRLRAGDEAPARPQVHRFRLRKDGNV